MVGGARLSGLDRPLPALLHAGEERRARFVPLPLPLQVVPEAGPCTVLERLRDPGLGDLLAGPVGRQGHGALDHAAEHAA